MKNDEYITHDIWESKIIVDHGYKRGYCIYFTVSTGTKKK